MWPVWTRAESRLADQDAMAHGMPFAGLLALAGFRVAETVRHFVPEGPVVVLVGPGANGGDGIVAAGLLARLRPVTVLCRSSAHFEGATGWLSWAQAQGVQVGSEERARAAIHEASVVVDALFGTGFHGALNGVPEVEWLKWVEEFAIPTIAVDIPSGVDADSGHYDGPHLKTLATVTMQAAKWGLVTYPGASHTGRLVIADIGLKAQSWEKPFSHFIDPQTAGNWMPRSDPFANKYRRGHVVVIGGSRSMPGAPVLSAMAALKAGAGLVELVVPESARQNVQASPALIVHSVPDSASGSLTWSDDLKGRAARGDAIVVGPGMGRDVSLEIVGELIKLGKPTVVDADGLRLVSGYNSRLPKAWVLTPHAGEMGRLLGISSDEVNSDRRRAVLQAAEKYGCSVLLKGRYSIAGNSQSLWVNPTGDETLATAGSGDVLSGLVGRLLALGMDSLEALALAVYWHGWAGELAAQTMGMSVIATDLIDALHLGHQAIMERREPGAFNFLR